MSDNDNKLSPETEVVKEMIAVQAKELDVRLKEVGVETENLQNQKEVALASIEAQVQDRIDDRRMSSWESTKSKYFIVAVLFILCFFILILVAQGQAAMAQKLFEIAAAGGLGWLGGYGYARMKFLNNESDE